LGRLSGDAYAYASSSFAAIDIDRRIANVGLDQQRSDDLDRKNAVPSQRREVPIIPGALLKSLQQFRDSANVDLVGAGQSITVRAGAPAVRAVELRTVREEFDRRYATGETDAKKRADAQRKAFIRAMDKLGKDFASWRRGNKSTPLSSEIESPGPADGRGHAGHPL
jgi:hypothetical protein